MKKCDNPEGPCTCGAWHSKQDYARPQVPEDNMHNLRVSEEEFYNAIRNSGLSAEEIATAIRLPLPTVQGWLDGSNAPHELMRKGVITVLKKYVYNDTFRVTMYVSKHPKE